VTGELFETFDETGRPTGLVPRTEVHARGLWHRSAHVFLFRSDGGLYMQRRASTKDLYPGRWDFSVGEHLRPGEDYLDGARRGLREELGLEAVSLEPLGGVREFRCDVPALGIADHELQAAFRGLYDGPLEPDGIEVAEVRVVSAHELGDWLARAPEDFTPWLIHELRERPGLGPFCLRELLRGRTPTPRGDPD